MNIIKENLNVCFKIVVLVYIINMNDECIFHLNIYFYQLNSFLLPYYFLLLDPAFQLGFLFSKFDDELM